MEVALFFLFIITFLTALSVARLPPKSAGQGHRPIIENQESAAVSASRDREAGITDKIAVITAALGVQKALMLDEDTGVPGRALDQWSLGYISGFSDILMRHHGINVETDEFETMRSVIYDLFGESSGSDTFRQYLALKQTRDTEFFDGTIVGGEEVFVWLADRNRFPMGWLGYVRGIA